MSQFGDVAALVASPEAWVALITLIVMEVVLGIDNLVFVSILSNKLPEAERGRARRLGIGLALVLRLVLLSGIAFIVSLTRPVLVLPFAVPSLADGHPMVDLTFSWRDLILMAGGLFLVWKATSEIHHTMDPQETGDLLDKKGAAVLGFGAAIVEAFMAFSSVWAGERRLRRWGCPQWRVRSSFGLGLRRLREAMFSPSTAAEKAMAA